MNYSEKEKYQIKIEELENKIFIFFIHMKKRLIFLFWKLTIPSVIGKQI